MQESRHHHELRRHEVRVSCIFTRSNITSPSSDEHVHKSRYFLTPRSDMKNRRCPEIFRAEKSDYCRYVYSGTPCMESVAFSCRGDSCSTDQPVERPSGRPSGQEGFHPRGKCPP